MSWFINLSTRSKLLYGFGSLLALLLCVIAFGLWSVIELRDVYNAALELANRRATQTWQHEQMLELFTSKDQAEQAALEKGILVRRKTIDDMTGRIMEAVQDNPKLLDKLKHIETKREEYRAIRDDQMALVRQGTGVEIQPSDLTQPSRRFKEISDLSESVSEEFVGIAAARVTTLQRVLTGLGILAVMLALLLVALFSRLIATPLASFTQFATRVGQGDLTQQAATEGHYDAATADEVGRLGGIMNQMVAGLRDMAGQTAAVTENLNAATAEILAATQEQAVGTKQQAATIQEITTTMEEIRQSGAQITERARQVGAVAEGAATASASGTQAVQDTNRTMQSIREQVEELAENIVALSEKTLAVGEIIVTVNDVAERSNLLALNAAIEAASAGEQGSRFAVVAGEMKNLADQAKDSTVQVRTILGEIQKGINRSVMLTEEAVKRVEVGKQRADQAELTIRELAGTTQESVQAFQQIIAATGQQQIGFEQVTQGMLDIRQAASQSAVGTVQLEKAVASLNAQSQKLRQSVGRYQLNGH